MVSSRLRTRSFGRKALGSSTRCRVLKSVSTRGALLLLGLLLISHCAFDGFSARASGERHRKRTTRLVENRANATSENGEKTTPGGKLQMFSRDGKPLGVCPLQHTDVQANISGFVARVDVEQHFANMSQWPIEAIYTFPLPNDAAVDAMTMTIGDRKIVGKIKRREEARQIYQAAKNAGKNASLLDQERPNIFTQAVANILPGQNITISISYVDVLKYDEGSYEWSFPTVVGPRYTPSGGYQVEGERGAPSDDSEVSPETNAIVRDADAITPPIAPSSTTSSTRSGHDLSLAVYIDAGVPLGAVHSQLHAIDVTRPDATRAVVRLRDGVTRPNRDFILRFRTAGQEIQTGVLASADGKGGGYFTLIMQPPASPPATEIAPKEMIFVIDQTGSQSGWPIEKSKETMRYCLKRLHRNDTFQILGFNTDVFPCFDKPVSATPENIALAWKFIAPLQGAGGTDILKSVEYALKMPDDPARLRIISYMTDGFIGNDMQVIDFIQKNRGRARMFPFGIGNSVNRFLIDEMARAGGGAAEYLTLGLDKGQLDSLWNSENAADPEAIKELRKIEKKGKARRADNAATRFYRRIENPLLLAPRIDWNGLPVEAIYPQTVPDVFSVSPIIVKGRYTRAAEGDITVAGVLRGRAWSQKVHVVFPASSTRSDALPSLWARARIADLQSRDWLGAQSGNPDATIKEQIVQTALDYDLMSQWTSFVAVEERVVNPSGQSQTADVPVEMAEGVSPDGIFGKRSGYRVAAGQTFSSRQGDPLITVEAPQNSRDVVALLPDGSIKRLKFNALSRKWEARFDIPTYFAQGEYAIRVVILSAVRKRQQIVLRYHVDLTAPRGQGAITALGDDAQLQLALETDADTVRVAAILPWGAKTSLKMTTPTRFQTRVDVPEAWRQRKGAVTYILTDAAHNRTTISVDLSR